MLTRLTSKGPLGDQPTSLGIAEAMDGEMLKDGDTKSTTSGCRYDININFDFVHRCFWS